MAGGVRLEFAQFGDFDSFSVYRSEFSMDIEDMPPPLATNLPTMYYVDETVVIGIRYFYRVAVVRDQQIIFSEEVNIIADVWLPSRLFDTPEYGVWFDFSDVSTMYQDVDKTTPVTGDGQPVALVLDKSGNDYHAKQSTPSKRPIYKTDGVLHWLHFDGEGQYLQVARPIPTDRSDRGLFVAIEPTTTTSTDNTWVIESYGSDNTYANLSLGYYKSNGDLATFYPSVTKRHKVFNFYNQKLVIGSTVKSGVITMTSGGREITGATETSPSIQGSTNSGFNIGTYRDADARFYKGRMYGLVFITRETSSIEVEDITRHLSEKTG